MNPTWLALFAPLPADAVVARKPVASPGLVASGKVDAIARWERITVNVRTEQIDDDDEHAQTTSLPSQPSASDVAALRALGEDVIERAPARGEGERR